MATQAVIEAVQAVTLDDEKINRLAVEVSKQSDFKHEVASFDDIHARRLQRLTRSYGKFDDHNFDFKVYLSTNVNAFAMADGSIRIYSGLMEMMDDEELLFVLGHEMGHVVEKHSVLPASVLNFCGKDLTDNEIDNIPAKNQVTVFGYACDQSPELMSLPIILAHRLSRQLSDIRFSKKLPYLMPDGKVQVGVDFKDRRPMPQPSNLFLQKIV